MGARRRSTRSSRRHAVREAAPRTTWTRHAAIALGLALVTALAYAPVLDAGFLNWDDPPYVTANPHIRTLSWSTVAWAATTFHEGIWHPLTWLSLALDHAVYGLDPRGFHLTNLLLHVANTVLVFLVLEQLTGARGRSALVAALFGLHPMHVESVAWVTERKDVLSTCFWLLTIAAYARFVRLGTRSAYLLLLGVFGLGLASKPMLVTLPFVLLLLDYWPLRRLSWRAVLEKAPLFLLAAAVAAVSIAAVGEVGRQAVPDPIPPLARLGNAAVSCVQYVGLTLWPAGLSPWYSHPWFEGPPLTLGRVAAALALLVGTSALVVLAARRVPYAAVGWFWFLGTLVPVLGLVYNGRQGMADRYAYVPHIGLFLAVVWSVADVTAAWPRAGRRAIGVGVAVVLVAIGVRTAAQARIWKDDRTFWSYTARTNPHSFIAHQALALIEQANGRTVEAMRLYARATRLRPELGRVHIQFARLLARSGRHRGAASEFRKALEVEPHSIDARLGLAQALLARGRRARARRELERVLALRPDHPEARRMLARASEPRPVAGP